MMMYIATFNWGWLLGAGLIGLAMGWIAVVQHGDGLSRAAFQRVGVVIVVLLVVSLSRLLPGRPGYWLDLALLMLAAYLAGCLVGSWLRHQVVSRSAPTA
jgi:hypothetical protein